MTLIYAAPFRLLLHHQAKRVADGFTRVRVLTGSNFRVDVLNLLSR